MLPTWVEQSIPLIVTALTAIFALVRGQRKLRLNLRYDAETLKVLPEASPAHGNLMRHVIWQAKQLHEIEARTKLDWTGISTGIILIIGPGYATIALFGSSEWWRWFGIATAFFALIGIVGLFTSVANRKTVAEADASDVAP